MPDYNNNCIYKICCKDVNITDIYVGHTTNFYKREGRHKSCCSNENGRQYFCYIYYFIRENGGWDNWEMIKLYDYPCDSRTEAQIEELKCYKKLNAKLNTQKPYQSVEERKEYVNQHKQTEKSKIVTKKNTKKYYDNNREKLIEKSKKYREENLEKVKEYQKEHSKEYRKKNVEKRKLYAKEYNKLRVNCPNCNKIISKKHLNVHMKTKNCIKINQIE